MAFAHYPHFYSALWRGLRPLCASRQFDEACRALRGKVEYGISRFPRCALELELLSAGYAAEEINRIRALIEVFSNGNMPYLMLATLARLLLENHSLSIDPTVEPRVLSRSVEQDTSLLLMEPHHGNEQLKALFEDIKATLELPFVNTDYRALARWPSYLDLAWQDLKPQIRSTDYEALVSEIHATATKLALELPNPGALTSEKLQAAAMEDKALDEIRTVVRLFQYLLPGLVANIGFFRAQLL